MGYGKKVFCVLCLGCIGFVQAQDSQSILTKHVTNQNLALIINKSDPVSVEIGAYYKKKRRIPDKHVVAINLDTNSAILSPESFGQIKEYIDSKLPHYIQAYAITWITPYRVGCMSITSALALGYKNEYCSSGCDYTKRSSYYNADSSRSLSDYGVKPAMVIGASTLSATKRLIDRGIRADGTFPDGTAYLLDTSDKARNVRAPIFFKAREIFGSKIKVQVLKANYLRGKSDILFYFTGLVEVPQLETNTFLPGAVGDHLTSFGGMLADSYHMSSLKWLDAGATGSYGTVVEPCNYIEKFPNPIVLMSWYLKGDTLIEAYWKSVAMPGQGIFIGEPLATPYR